MRLPANSSKKVFACLGVAYYPLRVREHRGAVRESPRCMKFATSCQGSKIVILFILNLLFFGLKKESVLRVVERNYLVFSIY